MVLVAIAESQPSAVVPGTPHRSAGPRKPVRFSLAAAGYCVAHRPSAMRLWLRHSALAGSRQEPDCMGLRTSSSRAGPDYYLSSSPYNQALAYSLLDRKSTRLNSSHT